MRRRNRAILDAVVSCPKCNSEDYISEKYSDTIDFRNLELDVVGLVRSACVNCENRFETSDQMKLNSEKIRSTFIVERDRLRERDGLLSSSDIASIRKQFGLAQREAAILFGGGPNAFNKYESGEVLQSIPMDRLLRLATAVGCEAFKLLQAIVEHRVPVPISKSAANSTMNAQMYVTYGNKFFSLRNQTASKVVDVLRESEYIHKVSPVSLAMRETGGVASGYLTSSSPRNEHFVEIDRKGAV